MLSDRQRDAFDTILERVIAELPPELQALLEEVPLIVDDEPSDKLLAEMGIGPDDDLLGLHSGIPLTERSVMHSGEEPEHLMMFRGPILRMVRSTGGDRRELERQIRITLLHEMGHHFGLDEDDLERLGYG